MAALSGTRKVDVIIIGAGVAGLAALAELDRAGVQALCLEARDRIGGRIFTVRDPACPLTVDLGAEFVHGKPPETWEIIRSGRLAAYDCTENAAHIENGTVITRSDAWLPVDEIMSGMEKAAQEGPDRSFQEFLSHADYPSEAKRLATSYVEGFNAAHAGRIGIASLAQDSRAAGDIDGDQSFRLLNGYDVIPEHFLHQVKAPQTALRLNSVVELIARKRGCVSVTFRSGVTGRRDTIEAEKVVITVPLGVLQAGAIEFDPLPADHLQAARRLCFGQVFRLVLRFTDRLWERNEQIADAGFLLSNESVFPTWWTPLPFRTPLLTGWSAGKNADSLLGQSRECVVKTALEKLARIVSIRLHDLHENLAAVYFHDWSTDPFSLGAYSYAPVGGLAAREALASPIDGLIYFSGEATELNGHSATVHGAIASGKRTAREILAS